MRMQSLIICERILGVQHKDMIYKLMYRGAAYADTCFTAQALVKLFLDLQEKNNTGVLADPVRTEDVIYTIELLIADLGLCSRLLQATPVFKVHQKSWDKALQIISHLLHLVTQLPPVPAQELQLKRKLYQALVSLDP